MNTMYKATTYDLAVYARSILSMIEGRNDEGFQYELDSRYGTAKSFIPIIKEKMATKDINHYFACRMWLALATEIFGEI